jgi:hypothetical protein
VILCPGHLWTHVPKTAGTYTRARLLENGLGEEVEVEARRSHVPLDEVPEEWLAGRLVVSNIRNPWDWYVSFVHHYTAFDHSKTHGILKDLAGETPTDFKATLHRLLFPVGSRRSWFGRTYSTRAERREAQIHQEIAELPGGLYRWCVEHITSGRVQTWIDSYAIERGLSSVFGVEVSPGPLLNVNGCNKSHAPHGPAADYYDDESVAWVADVEAWCLDRFGYRGPGAPALRGVA